MMRVTLNVTLESTKSGGYGWSAAPDRKGLRVIVYLPYAQPARRARGESALKQQRTRTPNNDELLLQLASACL